MQAAVLGIARDNCLHCSGPTDSTCRPRSKPSAGRVAACRLAELRACDREGWRSGRTKIESLRINSLSREGGEGVGPGFSEAGGDEIEEIPAHDLGTIGLDDPEIIPVLATRWQIAQKLHAVTEPPLRGRR